MRNNIYVVGGGPAGISAAIYLKRFSHEVTIIEQNMMLGGQVIVSTKIENFLGFPEGIGGFDLASLLQKQVMDLHIPIIYQTCKTIKKNSDNSFSIYLGNQEILSSDYVIFAIGTKDRPLSIPGETEFKGKGLSTCATCDAPFFKHKTIAVIGGGDTALTETLYLSSYADVTARVSTNKMIKGYNVRTVQRRAAANQADLNGDGKVDGGDLAIWQQNYDPLGTGNNTFALGDWNGDGKIDGGDLALWQQNYDPIGSAGADGMGANVPEPATLLLIATGLAGACGYYRRRRVK